MKFLEMHFLENPSKVLTRTALTARILQKCIINNALARIFQRTQEKCIILQDLEKFLQEKHLFLNQGCCLLVLLVLLHILTLINFENC